jgi:hypothetical protein
MQAVSLGRGAIQSVLYILVLIYYFLTAVVYQKRVRRLYGSRC